MSILIGLATWPMQEGKPTSEVALTWVEQEPATIPDKATKGKKGAKKGKKAKKSAAHRYCPICEVSGHDGRAHRYQGGKKKVFSQEELAAIAP